MDYYRAADARRAISPEEELQLVERARSGEPRAVEQLVTMHQGLIGFVVRGVRCAGYGREDLEQQAQLGLLHALRIFDPERGVRFWTYARWWVRAYVHKFVWQNRRIVPLSTTRAHRRVASNLRKVEGRLGDRYGTERAAEELDVSQAAVERVSAALSLGDTRLDDPDVHIRVTSAFPQPDDLLHRRRVELRSRELVRKALDELRPRDREIVERRHLADRPETLAAVGRSLGISRERVRQLDVRALAQLRALVEEMQRDAEELARAG